MASLIGLVALSQSKKLLKSGGNLLSLWSMRYHVLTASIQVNNVSRLLSEECTLSYLHVLIQRGWLGIGCMCTMAGALEKALTAENNQ